MRSAAAKHSKPYRFRTRGLLPLGVSLTLALAGCSAELEDDNGANPDGPTPVAAPERDKVKHRKFEMRKRIPFPTEVVETSTLDKGTTQIQQVGQPGVRVRVVRITVKNGVEVKRDVLKKYVARQPIERIVLRGTWQEPKPEPEPASNCDSNYVGACVPIASDVDCGGGSGDGPEYVDSTVRVVGSDIYDLDNDGDGVACDS